MEGRRAVKWAGLGTLSVTNSFLRLLGYLWRELRPPLLLSWVSSGLPHTANQLSCLSSAVPPTDFTKINPLHLFLSKTHEYLETNPLWRQLLSQPPVGLFILPVWMICVGKMTGQLQSHFLCDWEQWVPALYVLSGRHTNSCLKGLCPLLWSPSWI